MDVVCKRVYDKARPADDYRVLVDVIWPQGLSKEEVKIDEWKKGLRLSTPRPTGIIPRL